MYQRTSYHLVSNNFYITNINQYEDLQLGLYVWMLQKDTPLNAHYFGKKDQFKTMIDTESTDFNDYFSGLKDQVKAVIRGIQNGDYSPDQSLAKASFQANQCRLCDYYVACHFPKRHQR